MFIPFYEWGLRGPAAGAETALLAFFVLVGAGALLYMGFEKRPSVWVAALLHMAGGLLSLTAPDMIVLLLGWELMTFSAFFILLQNRQPGIGRVAVRYLATHMGSAALFFIGAIVHWRATGCLAVAPAAAAAQGFFLGAILIKTAMIPFHFWLVDAYPRASYAGSVLLSIYATKVGVFTAARLVRVSVLGQPLLAYIGAGVAVVAVVCALRQHNARQLLAYHIVSQVGYMLAGVGLAAPVADGVPGTEAGLFHAINHIVYKALLMMVAGVVCRQFGHDDLRRMGGAARKMPVTFLVGIVASAAIAGVPPTSGYASKELLKQAAQNPWIPALLTLASVGTALSFIKFMYMAFLRPPVEPLPTLKDPSAVQRGPMLVLAALSLLNGVRPGWVLPGIVHDYYTPSALAFGLLPPLAAGLIWMGVRGRLLDPNKQPGGWALVWPERIENNVSTFFPAWRRWHNVHPQTRILFLFTFWLALSLGLAAIVR